MVGGTVFFFKEICKAFDDWFSDGAPIGVQIKGPGNVFHNGLLNPTSAFFQPAGAARLAVNDYNYHGSKTLVQRNKYSKQMCEVCFFIHLLFICATLAAHH